MMTTKTTVMIQIPPCLISPRATPANPHPPPDYNSQDDAHPTLPHPTPRLGNDVTKVRRQRCSPVPLTLSSSACDRGYSDKKAKN